MDREGVQRGWRVRNHGGCRRVCPETMSLARDCAAKGFGAGEDSCQVWVARFGLRAAKAGGEEGGAPGGRGSAHRAVGV